eukprot:9336-Heterococcus_DN1.PRE.3
MVSVVLWYAQARSGIVAVLDIGGRGMTCSLVDVQSGAGSSATPWGTVVATERCDSVGGEYIEELLVTESVKASAFGVELLLDSSNSSGESVAVGVTAASISYDSASTAAVITAACTSMNKDFVAANKGCNLLNDPLSLSRLYEAAESAKIELSKGQSTTINLPFITADATGPKHLEMTLSRAQFDRLTDAHVAAASAPCSAALAQAGVSPDKVKAVLLVGGCSAAQLTASAAATSCSVHMQRCCVMSICLTLHYHHLKLLPLRFYYVYLGTAAIHNSRIPAVQALAARVFKQQPVVSDTSEELHIAVVAVAVVVVAAVVALYSSSSGQQRAAVARVDAVLSLAST